MTYTTRQIFFLITIGIATVMFGFGCGGQVEPVAEKQAERESTGTIHFVEKDAVKGIMRGTYELDGHTIKFEVLRGESNPSEMIEADSSTPSHSIDARLCDDAGYCFSYLTGGHAPSGSNWIQENPEHIPDDVQARKNSDAMEGLRIKLESLNQNQFMGLEEELNALKNVSTSPPDQNTEYDPLNLKPQSLNTEMPLKGISALSATSAVYTHYIQVWREPLAKPIAYHSATWSYIVNSSGTRIINAMTCNHGACPLGEKTTLYCTRSFPNRSMSALPITSRCDVPPTNGTTHPSGSVSCCNSPYMTIPGNVGHVCNDDSRLQRDLIIVGIGPVNAPYCTDRLIPEGQAPYCW